MIVIRGLAVNFPAATLGPVQSQKNVVHLVKFDRSIQGKILESQFTQNQQSYWSHLVPGTASLKLIIYLSTSLNQIILQISLFYILLSKTKEFLINTFSLHLFPRLEISNFFSDFFSLFLRKIYVCIELLHFILNIFSFEERGNL